MRITITIDCGSPHTIEWTERAWRCTVTLEVSSMSRVDHAWPSALRNRSAAMKTTSKAYPTIQLMRETIRI
jgi:hypothetical protein